MSRNALRTVTGRAPLRVFAGRGGGARRRAGTAPRRSSPPAPGVSSRGVGGSGHGFT